MPLNLIHQMTQSNILHKLSDSTGLSLQEALAGAIGLAVLLLLVWRIVRQRRRIQVWQERFSRIHQILELIKPDRGFENNLGEFLEIFSRMIAAQIYAFYVIEPKSGKFILKAVRQGADDFGKVRPSYSGLKEFKKEEYHPPMRVPDHALYEEITLFEEGEVPMLSIPLGKDKGIVWIGPLKGEIRKKARTQLQETADLIAQGLDSMINAEKLKNQADVVIATGRAMSQISHVALNSTVIMELMIRFSVRMIEAAGGCYMENAGDGYRVEIGENLEPGMQEALEKDRETLGMLENLVASKSLEMIKKGDEAFYDLPPYLASLGMEALAVVRLGPDSRHFWIFWFDAVPDREQENTALGTMRLIDKDIRQILSLQMTMQQMSGTYAAILKTLAELLDNLSPYTVGYSDLMSRYSIVIAKELGLEEAEIRDIALAAYLSNIGMLGISTDLYQKEGQYSDQEFEMMKLHAEVGASIVRSSIANDRVADLILYHHERMDGNGYPEGLSGDEIPIGSRIIAVVQTFMAKINGRKYRDPLPFDQALTTLRAAAGAQLDRRIVDAFVGWFDQKRKNPRFNARSLGACWEMCCVPSSICEHCPVYMKQNVNCWEVQGNNCQAHGKSCDTCYVRTEYLYRKETVKA